MGTTTRCSYKGIAHHWSARVGGRVEDDVAWSYPEPSSDAEAVRGMLCSVDDRVDLEGRRPAVAVGQPATDRRAAS